MLHLCLVKIDPDFAYENYLHWFNLDTQKKITSYHFRMDQLRAFVSALLKYYYIPNQLNLDINKIKYNYNQHQRPYLEGYSDKFDFNLSHSGVYVFLGISDTTIGVDIEEINPETEINSIAKIVFSSQEQQLVNNNLNNFYTLWSKKEAYLKACGGGFFEQYQITTINLDLVEIKSKYQIYAINFDSQYRAAICLCN